MAKPVVDGLERELHDKVRFIKVNVGDDDGAQIASRYGIHGVPAFIMLDEEGRVIYRQVGGKPDAAAVRARLQR
jgi:thiol-disulfide isomerase/thioredoxin